MISEKSQSLTVFVASPDIQAEQALGVLRLAGPLDRAGMNQVWWNEAVNSSEQIKQADLVVIQRNFPQRRQAFSEIITAARQGNKPVVFEMDDLLWELPAEHPDRQNQVYADALIPMLVAAQQADAITVATPELQTYCQDFHSNVCLLPNYLNERLWAMRSPQSRVEPAGQPITIGFMGGNSHLPDLEIIASVLQRLCNRYGSKLILQFWGLQPPAVLMSLPNTRCTPIQIARYDEFAAFFLQRVCEIGIAPLRQGLFNDCKSSIKFLEYSAAGLPGVYSRAAPYRQAVVEGETGLLASSLDEWEMGLTQLIEQPETRLRIASQAQEAVRKNWLLADHASAWEQAYRQIIHQKADKVAVFSQQPGRTNASSLARPIPNSLAARIVQQWQGVSPDRAVYPNPPKPLPDNQDSSTTLRQDIECGNLSRPQASRPQASIIILSYNNLDLTRQCLDSIYIKTDSPCFEVVAVDNASQDNTPRFLLEYAARHANMKVILNPINEGFARGNNIGAAAASGDSLVFLNNDTVVMRGWLAGLLRHLDDPMVGMVGPVTNFSSNESRIAVDYDPADPGLAGADAFAESYTRQHAGQTFEVEMLLLLCVAMRNAVYAEVGGIDERYGIGMFEDEDFSQEIRNKGYRLLCAEDVFIHHWGSATFSKLGLAGYWLTHEANRIKFEQKWGRRWVPQLYRPEYQREHVRQLVDGSLYLAKQVINAEKETKKWYTEVLQRDQALAARDQALAARDQALNKIYWSRGWRLLKLLWRLRRLLIPPNSLRERLTRRIVHGIRTLRHASPGAAFRNWISRWYHSQLMRRTVGRVIPSRLKAFYRSYRQEYPLVDRTRVTLYAPPSILPDYFPRRILDAAPVTCNSKQVTLISTVRNEARHAKSWLESLLKQTRLPDELVITDGGSADNTVAIIRDFALSAPIPVQVIEAGRVNVSRGRNIAIQNASHSIIACTDFGCILEKDWLANLILPFELDENTQLSAGFYEPLPGTDFQNTSGKFFIPEPHTLNPQSFLPSGRSVAMQKSLWARAGGYPEYLTLSGEDTLFDYQAKLQGGEWAFVPQAKVSWRVVRNFERLADAWFRYARGDGEVGMFAPAYWSKTRQVAWFSFWFLASVLMSGICVLLFAPWGWLIPAGVVVYSLLRFVRTVRRNMVSQGLSFRLAILRVLVENVISYNQFKGFFAGVRNRSRIQKRQIEIYAEQLKMIVADHPDCKGVVVFPPTHDWGFMFQRPHQMARAFARSGYLFFFHVYNLKTDAVVGFQEVEPNLYTSYVPMDTYRVLDQPVVYIGSPWHRATLAFFDRPVVIYDHYDDLGVWNARQEDHEYLLQNAKVVLATARTLLEKAQSYRPDILYVPNAVDYEFIQRLRPSSDAEPPNDLKPILASGKPIIGYSGAIAEWFDYDLLRIAAQACPDLEFVLIGVNYDQSLDRSHLLESGLANLHWLGMKAYDELFDYVWRFDVGIIPFKVNEITLGTSPIKMYEYMACGKPVLSSALPECMDSPGMFIIYTPQEFIENLYLALMAGTDPAYLQTIDAVAQQNTWEQRAQAILSRL